MLVHMFPSLFKINKSSSNTKHRKSGDRTFPCKYPLVTTAFFIPTDACVILFRRVTSISFTIGVSISRRSVARFFNFYVTS